MTFAEKAEQELAKIMTKYRHGGTFKKMEQSHQGEHMVIRFLERHEEATSPKHLAEKLNLSSARIAALLNSLEKKGLIERNMDPQDRRRVSVTLTVAGKEIARREKKKFQDRVVNSFTAMGEEHTQQFLELLNEFISYSGKECRKEEGEQS